MTPGEILRDALQLLEQEGWCRYVLRDARGYMCLEGACLVVLGVPREKLRNPFGDTPIHHWPHVSLGQQETVLMDDAEAMLRQRSPFDHLWELNDSSQDLNELRNYLALCLPLPPPLVTT